VPTEEDNSVWHDVAHVENRPSKLVDHLVLPARLEPEVKDSPCRPFGKLQRADMWTTSSASKVIDASLFGSRAHVLAYMLGS
jgi:hypothetical protein